MFGNRLIEIGAVGRFERDSDRLKAVLQLNVAVATHQTAGEGRPLAGTRRLQGEGWREEVGKGRISSIW